MAEAKIDPNCKYTPKHEWVRLAGEEATVGITDYAQKSLGDIVFVELPENGDQVSPGDSLGVVESVKAAEDYYSPVGGEVSAVNEALSGNPALVNQDCYGDGWFVKLQAGEVPTDLLSPEEYEKLVAGLD